jgi:hypothetical protein
MKTLLDEIVFFLRYRISIRSRLLHFFQKSIFQYGDNTSIMNYIHFVTKPCSLRKSPNIIWNDRKESCSLWLYHRNIEEFSFYSVYTEKRYRLPQPTRYTHHDIIQMSKVI